MRLSRCLLPRVPQRSALATTVSCAETRLADQLPPEWEGVDITGVGAIDELPQSAASGTRFAFAVERI
jgi:hypothetical protein